MYSKSTAVVSVFPAAGRILLLAFFLLHGVAKADELTLSISLGLSPQQAAQAYQPIVNYLSEATGQPIRLQTSLNALTHWQLMRRQDYDLVLDGPAFTAYRAAKMDYTVIGKLPDVLSFTLVAHADQMLFESDELIGRTVASQPSPSLGALRLAQLYPNPMRQPELIQRDTHAAAGRAVVEGNAVGAMIPSPLVASFPDLVPIYISEQAPAPGFSTSPRVSPEVRQRLRQALLDAPNNEAGRAMLEALNVPEFEAASNETYLGLETMLEGLWGY